jgi:hypothetical protein
LGREGFSFRHYTFGESVNNYDQNFSNYRKQRLFTA